MGTTPDFFLIPYHAKISVFGLSVWRDDVDPCSVPYGVLRDWVDRDYDAMMGDWRRQYRIERGGSMGRLTHPTSSEWELLMGEWSFDDLDCAYHSDAVLIPREWHILNTLRENVATE